MRNVKEILRLKWEAGLSFRQIGRSCNLSHHTVREYVAKAEAAGLSWPLPAELDEVALEAMLFPDQKELPTKRPALDFPWIHQELRKKHVTLQLIWVEYKRDNPDGYQYSQFCELYRRWSKLLDISMHQVHRAGEKLFVDYAGDTIPVVDPKTGEVKPAYLFVATLGASSYTYAEAVFSLDLASWIASHRRAFEFFGGVTEVVVPDNPRTGVSRPCYYEPELNATYLEMAVHYGTAIVPARVRKPKDKAKVENAVLQVERQILAPLRNRTFFSLAEVNRAVAEALEELNRKPFQKLEGSRRSFFETIDRPALKPLPAQGYEFAQWKKAKVNIDIHIALEGNYYSAPYQLVGKEVDARYTAATVEILHKGQRVASHARRYGKGQYATEIVHLPPGHQKYLEWTPERFINWAGTVGPNTVKLAEAILESRPHVQQAYRACLGIMRLGKIHTAARLEAAAARALAYNATSYRSVHSILEKGLDKVQPDAILPAAPPLDHQNLRGPKYYDDREDDAKC